MSNEEENTSDPSAAHRSGEKADGSDSRAGRYMDADGADFDEALLDVSTVDATSETFLPEEQPEGNLIESDGYGRIARVTALGQSGKSGLSSVASTASTENRVLRETTTLPGPAVRAAFDDPEVDHSQASDINQKREPNSIQNHDSIFTDQERQLYGIRGLEDFRRNLIESNRGKPLIMVRFENIRGMVVSDFIGYLQNHINSHLDMTDVETGFHFIEKSGTLLMGLSPIGLWDRVPNIDNAIGRLHEESLRKKYCRFDFGVARTQCNYISSLDEIYQVLFESSQKNLHDNLIRWSWTFFNKANSYFSGAADEAVIQPTVYYDRNRQTFSVKGGEVFVGGSIYQGYQDLINDIPPDQDLERIELLILEKLIIACEKTPGVLKFNISPQTMIDTFSDPERVVRLNRMLHARGLNPASIRFELVEKPYDETHGKLKEVCEEFFNFGITFAADDFGVKSQSHQVILDLGLMIKEFKLDPISFKFKPDDDRTKFLDNLAFIAYCKRLADNREALITAEAVEDVDTLRFLMEHQIHQFQANIFCGKMPISRFREEYETMRDLPEEVLFEVLTDPQLWTRQRRRANIFLLAREMNLY